MPLPVSLDAAESVIPEPTYRNATLHTPFAAGWVQTRTRHARQIRSWRVLYDAMDQDDLDTLVTFWRDTAIGGAVAWTWEHPETSASHQVRFHPEEDLTPEPLPSGGTDATRWYRVEFTIVEV
jgi:hypothetical protein